ncbi:MAG: hypothetical protein R2706_20600 [Acidimicrobiales bacterium]
MGFGPPSGCLTAACEAPGRCSAYESTSYHEIDILETNGAQPTRSLYTSGPLV